ncbi:MAG: NAD(P)/FAD-dependent oxidoreductase [Methanomicrobia archaeon]|nr:NAD(P)/FAD-dependent oxidoreductase [Methanomicrobia archaeon]
MYDVIVIGAGVSGLLSALVLSKNGKKVLVLEKEREVGGICQSYKIDGYTIDNGPHIITRLENGPLRKLITQYFDVSPDFIYHGEYYVRDKDKLYSFPWSLKSFSTFSLIPRKDRAFLLQILVSTYGRRLIGENFSNISVHDLLKKRNLNKTTMRFADTLCYFMTGVDSKKASVARFLDSLDYKSKSKGIISVHGVDPQAYLSKLIKMLTKKGAEDQGYPKGGIRTIIDCMVQSLDAEIITEEGVKEILIENNRVIGVKSQNGVYKGKTVIYSGYASELPDIADLPENYKEELRRLEKVHTLTLWMGLKRKYFDKMGSEIWIEPRCWAVPVSNYDPDLAPKGRQLVGFGFILPKEYNLEEEKKKAFDGIKKIFPGIEKDVDFMYWQVLVPEKAAWSINQKMPGNVTPVSGLYLVGTDTTEKSMGITRASYSVLNLMKEIL